MAARKKQPPPPRSRREREPEEVVGEVVPSTVGPASPPATSWLEWYNAKATAAEQGAFDRAASVIDNGGTAYKKGGTYEAYVENWRSSGPAFYAALVNYRDTGGRTSLFAVPPKDYGPRPISAVRKGGPMEQVNPTMLVLHPGRYSYTDVTANGPAFRQWLVIVKKGVTVGQSQVSAAVQLDPLPGSYEPPPYYTDYEFTVIADTAWPTMVNGQKLEGRPTWLPSRINIVDYWGQVTTSRPDWEAPTRAISEAVDMAKGIATLAGVLALAYVVYTLKPAPPPAHDHPRLS